MIINIFYLFRNKPGIREKASNEDTDTEIRFALLKPEGSNWRCWNMDLFYGQIWITLEDDK